MSSAQFPLGTSGNAFIRSDPLGNVLVQFDSSHSKSNRPRSVSSPLKKSTIITSPDQSLSIIDATLPTFTIKASEPVSPTKTITAHRTTRRHSDKSPTDRKIIKLKKDVTPENKLNTFIKSDEIKSVRRRDSKLGNDSHSPRVNIYGEAKTLFTQLETVTPGSYLLLRLGKEIDNCIPSISDEIDHVKQMSTDLANEMKQFIHDVQKNSTYKQYKKAIKIVESGLQEEATEDLFGKLQHNFTTYDYEVHTQIILKRALNELQLNSTSPRSFKKTLFLTHLCEKLQLIDHDYFDKFPLGFQEMFRVFFQEAKIQLKTNAPKKHEHPLMISDQRTHKIETISTLNSSTAAITYMLSVCECEAMHIHQTEANRLLKDLQDKTIPGSFLLLKTGKEIDNNKAVFKKWLCGSFHPLSFDALNSMKKFYDSISKNEAYKEYLMHFNQMQKLNKEQSVKEIGRTLNALKKDIKTAKKANHLCDKFTPNDTIKKEDGLNKLLINQKILEIMMEAIVEKAIKECEEIQKVKLHEQDKLITFIAKIKYKIENFSKYLDRFPEGYVDLFNRLKNAVTELEHSQKAHKLLTATENATFSIKAINQVFKIFEEDILQIQEDDTWWVLKNLDRLQAILQELNLRNITENKQPTQNSSSEPIPNEILGLPSNPKKDVELLQLINKKLEKAKKFARLQQIRGKILNLIRDSKWTQSYLFPIDMTLNDENLLNLRESISALSMSKHEAPTIARSRTKKRFHSREDRSSLDKSPSSRTGKSASPSPRSNQTLTRSSSSASIEDNLISKIRIKTSNSPEANRPLTSLSDSTTSDSQSPRVVERSLARAKSCKLSSSFPRKTTSPSRIEDPKKIQVDINNEFINLLIAPGVDNNLQRNLIASYGVFFKSTTDDPPLVEFLKVLHKKFLKEGPYEKQKILTALRELLCSPAITLIHFNIMKPLILEIVTDAKSRSDLLGPFVDVVVKLISSLDSSRRTLGPPIFYSLDEYAAHYEVTKILPKSNDKFVNTKDQNKNILNAAYEKNVDVYAQSLKRINLFDYIQIDSSELEVSDFSVDDLCPHIKAFGNRFTQLSDWVMESIFLKYEKTDSNDVCRMIEFFIDMIDSLLDDFSKNQLDDQLRKAVTPDYLSAHAIFTTLQYKFIEDLFIKTQKKKKLEINKRHTNENADKSKINISENHLKKYLLFKEIFSTNGNFKELRGRIKNDLHCIPPMQLTIKDITISFEKEKALINNKINLNCVENLGNILYTMATHQKHLIPIYLPFGKQSSLFENTIIDFDQLFQTMLTNKNYHSDGVFDREIIDTLCRKKVKEIFSSPSQNAGEPRKEETKIQAQGNVSPRKEETKIHAQGDVAPGKEERKIRFET